MGIEETISELQKVIFFAMTGITLFSWRIDVMKKKTYEEALRHQRENEMN